MFEEPQKLPRCTGYSNRISGTETVTISIILIVVLAIIIKLFI